MQSPAFKSTCCKKDTSHDRQIHLPTKSRGISCWRQQTKASFFSALPVLSFQSKVKLEAPATADATLTFHSMLVRIRDCMNMYRLRGPCILGILMARLSSSSSGSRLHSATGVMSLEGKLLCLPRSSVCTWQDLLGGNTFQSSLLAETCLSPKSLVCSSHLSIYRLQWNKAVLDLSFYCCSLHCFLAEISKRVI